MAATLRELRGRIRSAGSIKKITKAQELIATSRIAKAQARVEAARPYAVEITNMLTNLANASALDHPLLVERENPKRAGVLVVSSDRGLCGAYNANVLRRSEELFSLLREEGKTPVLYVVGRKALGYYSFRNWEVTESWTGFSEKPDYENARRSPTTLVDAFLAGADDEGDDPGAGRHPRRRRTAHRVHRVQVDAVAERRGAPDRSDGGGVRRRGHRPADAVLVRAGCGDAVRRAAAALRGDPHLRRAARSGGVRVGVATAGDEVGHRQRRRPHQGPDAEANRERQAQITQEISEIVGGANALADAAKIVAP